ncbi:MAG TPA: DUF5010 domain-containing protein [Rariglobus sp.]|jgi:hypothetical protein|nr:DUF5010 domain-containing protein [Rariglobus sp.]
MKIVNILGLVLLLGFQTATARAQASVSFSSGTFTSNSVLTLAGSSSQEAYGVTLGDSTPRTTANGYVFGSCVANNNPNINYVSGSYGSYLSGGSGGSTDTAFNALLNTGACGGGATGALTLNNLTVNATYRVLFLMADTRTSLAGRAFSVSSGSTASPVQTFAFAGGSPSLGGYVLGTFTALATTQSFTISPAAYGYQLNAVLVVRINDVALQPVISDSLPVIASLIAYGASDAGATAPYKQAPLFAPYDSLTDGWWDNLVAEQLQARIPVVMLESTGTHSLSPADFNYCPGGLYGCNPYKLTRYVRALQRAGVTDQFKVGFFYQGAAQTVYNYYYGTSGAKVDFANEDSWEQVWWQRIFRPFFATIPPEYWFKLNGRVPVEFWGIGSTTSYTNHEGNVSRMLNYVSSRIQNEFNVTPFFILGGLNYDSTLVNCPDLLGDDAWYGTPSRPFTVTPFRGTGAKIGCMVPGATAPNFYNPADPHYLDPNNILLRKNINGTGQYGDTLRSGLEAMHSNKALFAEMEGYMDYAESCGIYRSKDPVWDFPNQYLNLVREYSDLRTVTLRLEAEGCDAYQDTTAGNSGGAFLRSGENLDVRALFGPPSASSNVSDTAYPPDVMFDGILTNKWYTPTVPTAASPVWLQYDYGSGRTETVTGYWLTSGNDMPQRDPKDWQLLGSNNGVNWTAIDTRTNQAFTGRNQTVAYTFSNATPYRFYRLNVTANAGGTSYGLQAADLMFKSSKSGGGGWAVTNTAAGEWIQFNAIRFSEGNYKFPIRYSSTAPHSVRLYIDGVALSDVSLPSTGSMDTFSTAYLGVTAVADGSHTLKLQFLDGGVDVDWLFIKKYDPLISFKSAINNNFLMAAGGGNGSILASSLAENGSERFSIDGLSGGVITSGDTVKLQSKDGLYVTAVGGGGSTIEVKARLPGTTETFTVVKVSGTGTITSGDQIALRTSDGAHYLTFVNATTVNASGTSVSAAQTFTVNLTPQ